MAETPKAMTRKEALAVLMQVQQQWLRNLSHDALMQAQKSGFMGKVYESMHVLVVAVHSKPQAHQHGFLCEACLLHYAEHFVAAVETWEAFVCTPCRDRLCDEGKLIEKPSPSDERL